MVHKAWVAFLQDSLTANGAYMCRIREGQVIHYGRSQLGDNSWCFMPQVCKTPRSELDWECPSAWFANRKWALGGNAVTSVFRKNTQQRQLPTLNNMISSYCSWLAADDSMLLKKMWTWVLGWEGITESFGLEGTFKGPGFCNLEWLHFHNILCTASYLENTVVYTVREGEGDLYNPFILRYLLKRQHFFLLTWVGIIF